MRDYASIKTARRVRKHLLRSHQTSAPQPSSMSYPYCRIPNSISNSISKTSRRSLQTTSFPLLQSLNTSPDYTQHGTYKQLWQNNNENKKLKSSITCISYNVLSQIQLDKHGFVYADVIDETCKNWSHRKQLLEAQFEKFIKNDDVDIFCLQEVDDDQVICFYQPFFEKFGYDILYQRKTTGSKRDPSPPDGLALVYKNDRFELQMKEKVKYLYEYQSTNIPSLKLSYAQWSQFETLKRVKIERSKMAIFGQKMPKMTFFGVFAFLTIPDHCGIQTSASSQSSSVKQQIKQSSSPPHT